MNIIRNERGGSLLIVLLILVVFTVLGMGALAMNISVTKQLYKKEDQVQARHLAEMGILHYKTEIENEVKKFNGESVKYMAYNQNGEVDMEKSIINYNDGLCKILDSVKINKPALEIGEYSYTIKDSNCQPDKIELLLISHGVSLNGKKDISATITLAPQDLEELPPTGNSGQLPQKPQIPNSNAPTVNTLNDIKNGTQYKVKQGITDKNPFSTTAAVEILGALDMQKKSQWTFGDNFVVNGSVGMKTAGANLSSIDVSKDFYIGGAFDMENHNKVKVGGDFIAKGNVKFGTNSLLLVSGNALFDSVIEKVMPHARITIAQNAYFKAPLEDVNPNATFCVRGDAFLWKNNKWEPYTSSIIKKDCPGTSPGNPPQPGNGQFDWIVLPNVDADYGGN